MIHSLNLINQNCINRSRWLLVVLATVTLALAGVWYWFFGLACEDDWCLILESRKAKVTTDFGTCAARGYPIQETYPRQCRVGDRTYVEVLTTQ